jgi:hypothetical protein
MDILTIPVLSLRMNFHLLMTIEIFVVVVLPLLVLYLRGPWQPRVSVPSLVSIPILWYLMYSPLHELSHVAGTVLAGGRVSYVKLISSFWRGEFGAAWITPEGLTQDWQWLVMTSFPYLLDLVCLLVALLFLRQRGFRNGFLAGLLFMVLTLRPAFDFVCETIALLGGSKGDLYHLGRLAGAGMTWLFIAAGLSTAVASIIVFLKRPSHI